MELAREVVGGLKDEKDRDEKDKKTAEAIRLIEDQGDWEQEV